MATRHSARDLELLHQAPALTTSPRPTAGSPPASAEPRGLPSELEALVLFQREPEGPTLRVVAGGDLGFSGRLAPRASEDGAGPLREIAPVLRAADAAFANLESPLPRNVPEGALFAGPPEAAERLAAAGFTVLSVANNHALDYGPEGLRTTLQALRWAHIDSVGAGDGELAGQAVTTTPRHHPEASLLWLACARTLEPPPPREPRIWELHREHLLRDVAAAAARRDAGAVSAVVVSIHFGYMFIDYPDPEQRRLALDVANAGADLVLVHHAHVLQGVEVMEVGERRAAVCHNLGNLLFDWQEGQIATRADTEPQRSGALMVFDLDRRGVARVAALPLWVDDDMSLHWATGARGTAVLDRLESLSAAFGDDSWIQAYRRQRGERNTGLAVAGLTQSLLHGKWGALFSALRRLRPHHGSMILDWIGQRLRRGSGDKGNGSGTSSSGGTAP